TPSDLSLNFCLDNVMTVKEFQEKLPGLSITYGSGHSFVPEGVKCKSCKETWRMDTCHKFHEQENRGDRLIDGSSYIGRTIEQFNADQKKRTDGTFFLYPQDTFLQNDKYIDLDLNPESYQGKQPKNERGYVGKKQGFTFDHVIEEGDKLYLYGFFYYHEECWRLHEYSEEFKYFMEVFTAANIGKFTLNAIRSGYGNLAPWFIVTTPVGYIQIGWRKRVIHIDWSRMNRDFLHLFEDEETTKTSTYIHA
ncbi:unnamed protein product, partial [marine sediment metagenome]